jgi:Cu-Zn family superoxide dismutase
VRVWRWVVVAVVAVLLPAGFTGAAPAAAQSARPAAAAIVRIGHFEVWDPAAPPGAVTYDPGLVPSGALLAIGELSIRRRTLVVLHASGLEPGRRYGAHVHRAPCGPMPADSGAHYQNMPDPVRPSVDPAYANPRNEVWLDFSTDSYGSGGAVAMVLWPFRLGEANSVVLHEHETSSMPGMAGTAGNRVACMTIPL